MATPSKEQFLADLNENTFCGFQWCKQLYGYHLGNDGYVERIFARLDELGREKVKLIYGLYLKWEITHEQAQTKDAARWLTERTDKEYERKVKKIECQKETEKLTRTQVAKQILNW